jgi:hypothetical protein
MEGSVQELSHPDKKGKLATTFKKRSARMIRTGIMSGTGSASREYGDGLAHRWDRRPIR